jgi:hypothetical protein
MVIDCQEGFFAETDQIENALTARLGGAEPSFFSQASKAV